MQKFDRISVRVERARREWTQDKLAEVAGISTPAVSRLEKTGTTTVATACKIAHALDLPVSRLFTAFTPA